MAVVESAISFLTNRLGDELAREASLLSGVRDQVEWIETELRRMECFLIDADRSSSSSKIDESGSMKNWRRELRELVNSAEDAIDMFILRVESPRPGGGWLGLLRSWVEEVVARHKVASEIADIKLKLSSISDSRTTYGIESISQRADATGSVGRRIFQEQRLSSPSIPAETDLAGSASEMLEFITQLTSEESKRRCIFSVVGMDGGLGKTTFATKVYNDNRIKEHFEERAWVSVSQQYAVTDTYTALLRCFSEKEREDQLRQNIFRHLEEKKYLIVLDDVRTKEAWDSLKNAFPDSENGSRVLLTTGNLDVASHADQQSKLHELHRAAETDFIGFADDLRDFMTQLTSEEPKRLSILSVVGMGGSGKTTFAAEVYNDNKVKVHFTERGWVSVSQQYSVTDICSALLYCITKQNKKDVTQDQLKEYLGHKKYLIVLDDVWAKNDWNALKSAFPDAQNGSRVLLTTRNLDVALHADPEIKPQKLKLLSRDESWKLFCKKTFPEPKNFEEVGRQIVEKCHGLPLAIVAIGGMLAGKSLTEWEHVLKSISWQFGDQGDANISGILKLSYKDLPYDLKPCFLYLGIFREDEEFRAKHLIHMWAAEGFLQQRGDQAVEEVGEDNMRALARRSMIQVAKTSSTGGIKSCRMHDLLRDIAISEAKGDKFLQVERWSTNNALSSSAKSRRLAIHCHQHSTSSNSAASHLRSMFIYSKGAWLIPRTEHKSLYSRYKLLGFKLLRVLHLHNVRIYELPSEIGDLIHLRYMGCVASCLSSLPPSIGNLRSLQTLRIDSEYSIEIPPTIQKMQELRHLQLRRLIYADEKFGGIFDGQPRLEHISNLQTLTHVKAGEWVHNSLGQLKGSLRKLGITLDSDAYYRSITQLESLQSLSLASPQVDREKIPNLEPRNLVPLAQLLQLRKLSLWGKLEKMPDLSEFTPNLTKLTLSSACLNQDPVAALEQLQNLRILRLLHHSYMGEEMKCSAEGFPSLEYLCLNFLWNLDKWIIEEGAMRRLAHLSITYCRKLKTLPVGVEHLAALKKLEVWGTDEEFKSRLRQDGGVDWHLIQHIPFIQIR